MKKLLQSFTCFVLLLAFLYPQAEKAIHDFNHKNDFHCFAKNELHFHADEHNCSICDYNVPVSYAPVTGFNDVILTIQPVSSVFFFKHPDAGTFYNQLLPRAPPIV